MAKSLFGQVSKQRSGRYQARYQHPTRPHTPDGARNFITAPTTFMTKTAARTWLATIQTDIERGTWRSPEQVEADRLEAEAKAKRDAYTFGEYADTWMATRRLTDATRNSYVSYLETHLRPRWGTVPLKAITTMDVRAWLAVLAPNSPGARKKAAELFRAILNSAADDDLIAVSPYKRNMLGQVQAPTPTKKIVKREQRALSLSELDALAAEVPAYMRLLVLLSGLLGLRMGEALELRGKDISTTTTVNGEVVATVSITRAVTGQGKNKTVGAPKTVESVRSLPVPPKLATEIVELARSAGPEGLLFHPVNDRRTHIPQRTYQLNLKRAAERLGLGPVAPHDLRRTMVTNALAAGVPMADVQALAGHTTPSMTSRYAKSNAERLDAAVATINTAYVQRDGGAVVASLDAKRAES